MTRSITRPPGLDAVIEDLDLAARPGRPMRHTVTAVADALLPHLGRADLLDPEQRIGDPAGYRQHLLHVPEHGGYSLVALVWLPGQTTAIHDHISWCVVGVHEGTEHETRYRLLDGVLVEDGTAVAATGAVAALEPPGDIHRVTNGGDRTAISLHVYGADLRRRGTSIRRRYDQPVRRPGPTSTAAATSN